MTAHAAHAAHAAPLPPLERPVRRLALQALAVGAVVPVLSGCGFQLRGHGPTMVFSSLMLRAKTGSPVLKDLREQLTSSGVQVMDPVVTRPGEAPVVSDVVLEVLTDQRERTVVGITAAGQVRELLLRSRFKFRVRTFRGKDLIPDLELLQERDLSFTETQVLGKEIEEAMLYTEMQTDIVRQVMRRLAAIKGL